MNIKPTMEEELESLCGQILFESMGLVSEAKDDEKDDEKDENPFADDKSDEKDETEDNSSEEKSDEEESDESDESEESKESEESDDTDTEESSEDDSEEAGVVTSVFSGDIPSASEDEDDAEDDEVESETVEDTETDDFTGSESSGEFGPLEDFGIKLMMLSLQVHFWHVNCDKSAEHNTLDFLYQDLSYLSDRLLENIIAHTGKKITGEGESQFDFGSLEFSVDEDIGILEDVRDDASGLAEDFSDVQGVCNILGELCEKLNVAIYKLKQFGC